MDLGSVLVLASGFAALGAGVWNSVHKSKFESPRGQDVAKEPGSEFNFSKATFVPPTRTGITWEETGSRGITLSEPIVREKGKKVEGTVEELEESEHRHAE